MRRTWAARSGDVTCDATTTLITPKEGPLIIVRLVARKRVLSARRCSSGREISGADPRSINRIRIAQFKKALARSGMNTRGEWLALQLVADSDIRYDATIKLPAQQECFFDAL